VRRLVLQHGYDVLSTVQVFEDHVKGYYHCQKMRMTNEEKTVRGIYDEIVSIRL